MFAGGACTSERKPEATGAADPAPTHPLAFERPGDAAKAGSDLFRLTGLRPPSALNRPVSTARFYMDRSTSMGNYLRESNGALHAFAATLGEVLRQHEFAGITGAGFGLRVEQSRGIAAPSDVLDWQSNAPARCLASPMVAERAASRKTAALFVLITDGVLSPTARTCEARCPDGDEIGCVGQALFEYLQAGNGLWVIGVRVPYSGEYRAAAGSGSFTVASARRPIYAWIGGPNAQVGRAAAEQLVKWAVERQPPLDHIALEVWPGHWDDATATPSRRSTWIPWSAQSAVDAIEAWSTADDSSPTEIGRTLGFEPLWVALLRRLESIRRTLR
jgi:hypothetical protein